MKINKLVTSLSLAALVAASNSVFAETAKPTIVLVHGAFAGSSS
jgi:hypothetical protein